MLDFYVKTRIRFSLRDKRLFEITDVEITRVDCITLAAAKAFWYLETALNSGNLCNKHFGISHRQEHLRLARVQLKDVAECRFSC